MGSSLAIISQIVVSLEAVLGICLNLALLVLLCRLDIGKPARIYHISSIITAFLGFYTSFLLLIVQDVFIYVNGYVATVLYGPLLFYLPERVNEVLAIAFYTQAHAMWQIIPAPSIVQWMTLAKPKSSSVRRLVTAYTLPIIFYANSAYYMSYAIPSVQVKSELTMSIDDLFGTDSPRFHIYGMRLIGNNGISFLDIMFYDAIPTYLASYGLFAFSAVKIRSYLRKVGTVASAKATNIQRRFFRLQIAQVLLPLILLSPMICVMMVATICCASLDNLSLIIVFALWLSPSLTAFLLLIFVATSSRKRIVKTTTKF